MNLEGVPIFSALPEADREHLLSQGESLTASPGDVLFYEGDSPDDIFLILAGCCTATYAGETREEIHPPALLDPVASLGGLPHHVKITVTEKGEILRWKAAQLWEFPVFSAAARRFLASELHGIQTRLDEVAAPVHYMPESALLIPGPFLFENTTMIIALCEAETDAVKACLPPGLSLLQRPLKFKAPVFVALAKFPDSHPEHNPTAGFSYTETTYFIPVRRRVGWGFYVPHIYPSSWEPTLLGREIYGFPKRLGETVFEPKAVSLRVDGQDHLRLAWDSAEAVGEPRLIGAMSEWLGFERYWIAAAFQVGEAWRKAARLPPYRRVDVYNHKRILAPGSDHENPSYDIDQLTRARFDVLQWYQIARMKKPELTVSGGAFSAANLTLREAYRTQLHLRLGLGRVAIDYRAESQK